MTLEEKKPTPKSLGAYLKATRCESGIEIATIAEQTKISERNLRAMEAGEFALLPAEVFSRGFYRIYAGALSLSPDEIISRYDQEKGHQAQDSNLPSPLKDVGNMAERPSMLPTSTIGLALLILLLFGGFLCWYFSWNPASFFSQKLRSMQDSPEVIEQVQTDEQANRGPLALVSTLDIFSLKHARAEKIPSRLYSTQNKDDKKQHSVPPFIEFLSVTPPLSGPQ
jgi:cytoskeletal protein RodZ